MKYKKWNEWYSLTKQLYKEKGSVNVTAKFVFKGKNIGDWIQRQRRQYNKGLLTTEQIKKMEDLGMNWDGKSVLRQSQKETFLANVELLKQYIQEHGNTRVPAHYVVDGYNLGTWVSNIRCSYREYGNKLTNEQKAILDSLGFEVEWYKEEQSKQWRKGFNLLLQFLKEHPGAMPKEETVYKGIKIGQWIHDQRKAFKNGKLANERIRLLEGAGINLAPMDTIWEEKYAVAKKLYDEFHHIDVPCSLEIDGIKIGKWISVQRQIYNKSRTDMSLSDEQIAKLEKIGMNWNVSKMGKTSFPEQVLYFYLRKLYPEIKNQYKEFGFELDLYIPSIKMAFEYDGEFWHRDKYEADNKKDKNCRNLGITLIRIREPNLKDTDYAICYHRSEAHHNKSLEEVYSQLFKDLFNQDVDINIERDDFKIIKDFGKFAPNSWYAYYREAKKYYETNGDLMVPNAFVTDNKLNLGAWIANQRLLYKGTNRGEHISRNEIKLLEEIGMIWAPKRKMWDDIYAVAEQYYFEHGDLLVPRNCVYKGVNLGKWMNWQRNAYHQNKGHDSSPMSQERIDMLENIGMVWDTRAVCNDRRWQSKYQIAKMYYAENGDLKVPTKCEYRGMNLGGWISCQRKNYSRGSLSKERINKLEEIGMVWRIRSPRTIK